MKSIFKTTEEGMRLILEVIFTSFNEKQDICYQTVHKDISLLQEDPDDLVHDIIRTPSDQRTLLSPQQCIVHSTSWRYEKPRDLILTYLVFSDKIMLARNSSAILCLEKVGMAEQTDPSRPRPLNIQHEQVVLHGIRHISHLVKQKSQNFSHILETRSILAFQQMETNLAGRIY